MAKLAPQKITEHQKAMLEDLARMSGESIATIVRGILEAEYKRLQREVESEA